MGIEPCRASEMEDRTWQHLEFESDQITDEDLRRFRAYEAVCSFYYGVEVIAEELEEELAVIQRICRAAKQFAPEYDDKKVFEAWQKWK